MIGRNEGRQQPRLPRVKVNKTSSRLSLSGNKGFSGVAVPSTSIFRSACLAAINFRRSLILLLAHVSSLYLTFLVGFADG